MCWARTWVEVPGSAALGAVPKRAAMGTPVGACRAAGSSSRASKSAAVAFTARFCLDVASGGGAYTSACIQMIKSW